MLRIIGGIVVAIFLFLLVIGGIGRCNGASWAFAGNDTSARDKAQNVLSNNVDDSTTVDDLAQTIQDKFDVSASKAKSIATAVLAACKPDNCQALSEKLDALKGNNTNDQTKVLAVLTATTSATTPGTTDSITSGSSAGTNQSQAPQASGICKLQVIGPWSEINGVAPYRIEVGGGDVQHFDFYPTIGVKSVSYIVPPLSRGGIAQKWYGYGQLWQGNSDCASFDYVKDATDYAKSNATGQPGRLQQGHSGIVVDMRENPPKVYNTANLPQAEVDSLLALHKSAMNSATQPPATTAAPATQAPATTTQPPAATAAPAAACTGTNTAYTVQANFTVTGPAIINAWSDNAPWKPTETKTLVPSGTSLNLVKVGGEVWSYPATCTNDQLQKELDNDGYTAKSVDELKAAGLATN